MAQTNLETVRDKEIFKLARDETTLEVTVESDITLEDYERITGEKDWDLLKKWAESMKGKTVVFLNPTMEGGGVAMLRPPLVHLLTLLGVDAHWYVMGHRKNPEDPNPFIFTKLMHNILQRQTAPEVRINEEGKSVHQQWNAENAEILIEQPAIQVADVIMLDDPQPAPSKKHIEKVNPTAKWVWRNHIDTDGALMADPDTPQGEVSTYLLDECGIRNSEAIVTHPVDMFVHPELSEKTYFAPATNEPFDDLNRPLSTLEIQEGIDFINSEIEAKNEDFRIQGREADVQELVDTSRRRITLIARFDESKGMDIAMTLGIQTREKMAAAGVPEADLPQIIIVGNGSVDDPSGMPMFEKMLRIRREQYSANKDDIILMRLRHNYKAMNALMYPSQSQNDRHAQVVGMQTSESEGCETRISDWIRHEVPVVVADRGGMPLQVIEGESGLILDYDKADHDVDRGAEWIKQLMLDPEKYEALREKTKRAAETFNNREFTTTANATRLLRVFSNVLSGEEADKQWKIREMTDTD